MKTIIITRMQLFLYHKIKTFPYYKIAIHESWWHKKHVKLLNNHLKEFPSFPNNVIYEGRQWVLGVFYLIRLHWLGNARSELSLRFWYGKMYIKQFWIATWALCMYSSCLSQSLQPYGPVHNNNSAQYLSSYSQLRSSLFTNTNCSSSSFEHLQIIVVIHAFGLNN
jgi:hypothetical protein